MTKKELTGKEIKELISMILTEPDKCGFEVHVITKAEPQLRKISFVETKSDNLRYKLKGVILKILAEKYGSNDIEYVSADCIADEQRKLYIIPISNEYNPLSMLNTVPGIFNKHDINDATGIAFLMRYKDETLWAYQHLWSIMIPNKSRKNCMAKLISNSEGDIFDELKEPVITFAEKIDLLILRNNIVASDYKLLQNSFGFQDYIRLRADKTIEVIKSTGIVANMEKLNSYVERGNGKPKYAKKMMRITDSKVLKMDPELLWENIHHSTRWNGKIKEENGKFVLETFAQVEDLIDLLDERYTRSDITGEEYDTEVKQPVDTVK